MHYLYGERVQELVEICLLDFGVETEPLPLKGIPDFVDAHFLDKRYFVVIINIISSFLNDQ